MLGGETPEARNQAAPLECFQSFFPLEMSDSTCRQGGISPATTCSEFFVLLSAGFTLNRTQLVASYALYLFYIFAMVSSILLSGETSGKGRKETAQDSISCFVLLRSKVTTGN